MRGTVLTGLTFTLTLTLTLALAACGKGENAPGAGGVTQGEARALDEAAAMIEERRLPIEALAPTPPSASAAASASPDSKQLRPGQSH